jgi:hypothetical protein
MMMEAQKGGHGIDKQRRSRARRERGEKQRWGGAGGRGTDAGARQ